MRIGTILISLIIALGAFAGCKANAKPDVDAGSENDLFELEDLRWQNRVFLVFAPSPRDREYNELLEAIAEHRDGFEDRHLVVVAGFSDGSGMANGRPIAPHSVHQLRDEFRVGERGFTFILIGKDGTEKMRRKGQAPDLEEVFDVIDAMPMRQREMKSSDGSQ